LTKTHGAVDFVTLLPETPKKGRLSGSAERRKLQEISIWLFGGKLTAAPTHLLVEYSLVSHFYGGNCPIQAQGDARLRIQGPSNHYFTSFRFKIAAWVGRPFVLARQPG